MDFYRKLKIRLYIAVIYMAIGIMMIAGEIIIKTENSFMSSFGFALVVISAARIRKYFLITRSDVTIRKQEIAETDERNLSIQNKAKSTSFSIYALVSSLAVIALSIFNLHDIAEGIACSVCILIMIYWICYWVYQKKS